MDKLKNATNNDIKAILEIWSWKCISIEMKMGVTIRRADKNYLLPLHDSF
jgi:hypothetical protein